MSFMSVVAKAKFRDYRTSVPQALDLIAARQRLPRRRRIIIKPNLTNASKPPVTTDVAMVEAIYDYCLACGCEDVIIAEGCGNGRTTDVFDKLGYGKLARRRGIELVDLNEADTVELVNPGALVLRRFHVPKIVLDAFVISAPVLKDHSFTGTTIAMKNMFGIAPARFYAGSWNKSKLHSPSAHWATVDVCTYKPPDLCVVDASVALAGMHLAGKKKRLGVILAGSDPVAVDAIGTEMMGHEPLTLEYLRLANGKLGSMDSIEIAQ